MWKYIVVWILVSEIPVDIQPSTDEFGATSNIVPSIYTFTLEEKNKIKYFDSKEEAEKFYTEAKKREKVSEFLSGPGDRIKEVHIYELKEIDDTDR